MTMPPVPRPLGLLAELTHACPLHCPYCSNPIELARRAGELSTDEWTRVIREAAEIGVIQIGLSGGEPLLYAGLEAVVEAARMESLYSNLITSGVGLSPERAQSLRGAGLDAVQISLQSDSAEDADWIAGTRAHEVKVRACAAARDAGLPLGLNVVLHRHNIDRLEAILILAESLGAIRMELAHVQFAGWAWKNRNALLPMREQCVRAEQTAAAFATRCRGSMQVVYVQPDWFGVRPKPCLHGWGQRGITVNPRGDVLPCQAAEAIPGMIFENIRNRSLSDIWRDGPAFAQFRGTDWLPEPCRSCPEKERDFGGCRCQAALWTGDPGLTDPVCEFSPHRTMIDAMLDAVESGSFADANWDYRSAATSAGVTLDDPSPNWSRT